MSSTGDAPGLTGTSAGEPSAATVVNVPLWEQKPPKEITLTLRPSCISAAAKKPSRDWGFNWDSPVASAYVVHYDRDKNGELTSRPKRKRILVKRGATTTITFFSLINFFSVVSL